MPLWILPSLPVAPPPAAAEVVADIAGTVDHVAVAISRLPVQFRKPKIERLLTAIIRPIQTVENAFQQLLTQRTIDTAVGAQLDAIGLIVNEPRNGLGDDEYRRLVRARVATSRSRGTVEDLLQIVRLVVDDQAATIEVRQAGVAAVTILVVEQVPEAVADILGGFLREAKSGGVKIVLETGAQPVARWFRWNTAHRGYGSASDPTLGGTLIHAQ